MKTDDFKTEIKSADELAHVLKVGVKVLVNLSKSAGRNYQPFDLKRNGSGKWRHIDNPSYVLKGIQKKINKLILRESMLKLPINMIGGIPKKSTTDNAIKHIGQEMVLTLDIKDCFPETTHKAVGKIWKDLFGFDWNTARMLTQLTTLRTHLPQGSPTSLPLCNLCLLPLFKEINEYTNSKGLSFTMFVDDLAISGRKEAVQDAIDPIVRIIQKHGYAIRSRKIRKMPARKPQIITGIQTNKKLSINKGVVRQIRAEIVGLAKGQAESLTKQSIKGEIAYVKKISPEKGRRLTEFADMLLPDDLGINTIKLNRDEVKKCMGRFCLASQNINKQDRLKNMMFIR